MKKTIQTFLLVLLICCPITVSGQSLSLIEGAWTGNRLQTMKLYRISSSELKEIASTPVDAYGRFAFALYMADEGFYAIGPTSRPRMGSYQFYLTPGCRLQFTMNDIDWQLTGNVNTPENQALADWHNLIKPLEQKSFHHQKVSSTFKDFFPQLEQLLPTLQGYQPRPTHNTAFDTAFAAYRAYHLADVALTFIQTPRSEQPESSDFIEYYRHINVPMLSHSTSLLDYPGGMLLLDKAYWVPLQANTTLTKDEVKQCMVHTTRYMLTTPGIIANDTLKGEYLLYKASRVKKYEAIMEMKQNFSQFLMGEEQQKRFEKLQAKLDDHSTGHVALDFKYKDINGKEVALSDLKGKVVYIDVWATWCGPCKKEMPHMKKLEEEYVGNDQIAFVSVSVDKSTAEGKWRKMVADMDLKGIQLFAGDRSDEIIRLYKIKGIPRFILVGKDGNLVASDAPRPSSDEIRPLLNDTLSH